LQLTIGKPVYFYSGNELMKGVVSAILSANMVIVQADDGIHRFNPHDLLLERGNTLTEFYLPESD